MVLVTIIIMKKRENPKTEMEISFRKRLFTVYARTHGLTHTTHTERPLFATAEGHQCKRKSFSPFNAAEKEIRTFLENKYANLVAYGIALLFGVCVSMWGCVWGRHMHTKWYTRSWWWGLIHQIRSNEYHFVWVCVSWANQIKRLMHIRACCVQIIRLLNVHC